MTRIEKGKKESNMNMKDVLHENKVKKEVKNIDGLLAGSGNCRSQL